MSAKLHYSYAADALAEKAGVPPSILSALINAESGWNPNAISSTGATGLGQFTSATAAMYGLMGDGFDNRKDAALNLTATAKYLADLKRSNPTWRAVIGHYSGQGEALANYAQYSAGQVLIAAIDAVDTRPVPTPAPDPTSTIESLEVTLASGPNKWAGTIRRMGAVVLAAGLGGAAIMAPQQAAPVTVASIPIVDATPPVRPSPAADSHLTGEISVAPTPDEWLKAQSISNQSGSSAGLPCPPQDLRRLLRDTWPCLPTGSGR